MTKKEKKARKAIADINRSEEIKARIATGHSPTNTEKGKMVGYKGDPYKDLQESEK